MSIRRAPRPEGNFYMLDKSMSEDKSLTWEARGMLIFLLGKPDNWTVSIQALVNQTAGTRKQSGRDSVYAIIGELKAAGYVVANTARVGGGLFGGIDYMVCEHRSRLTENPDAAPLTDLPFTAEPDTANPTLTSIDSKQVLKKNKPTTTNVGGEDAFENSFNLFWSAYPKRQGKRDAQMAFKKIKLAVLPDLLAALEQHKSCEQWKKNGGAYIPLPATWLRGERWNDEQATTPIGSWFDTLDGIKGKAASLSLPVYTGSDTNAWLRYTAKVWVAVGDGPHWDRESSVYPLAVSLRNQHSPSVGSAIDGLINRMAA